MSLRRPILSLLLALALVVTGWSLPTAAHAATDPSISGTVTAADGGSVQDTSVSFYRWDDEFESWDWYDGTSVDPDSGDYSLDLAAGRYKVQFENWDRLVPEFYDDAEDLDSATEITVDDEAVTGIDAELAVAGAGSSSLSGTVFAADNGSVAGVTVEAWAYNEDVEEWEPVQSTSVDPDTGAYELALDEGGYRLHFVSEGRLISEYFDDVTSFDDAASIAVGGAGVTGVDAVLAVKAAISGTVTAADHGTVDGVQVEVLAWNSDWESWEFVDNAAVQPSGAYALLVAPGQYKIRFSGGTRLISEYYDNSPSQSAAAKLDVPAAGRSGINAELAVGGVISGVVSVSAGASRSGLSVEVETTDGDWAGASDVDAATGQYAVGGLAGGDYIVRFDGNSDVVGEYYDNVQLRSAATAVSVAAGGVRPGVDATLAKPGKITGTVTVPSGVNQDDISVTVLTPGADGDEIAEDSVNADGTYAVDDVPAGNYLVRFSGDGVATQYYNAKYLRSAATQVTVSPGATTPSVNAALVAGTTISGRVSLEESDYPDGVTLNLYSRASAGSAWERVGSTWPEDGTYTFAHVPNGDYIVEAENDGEHAGEFWNGSPAGADTAAGATVIAVTGTPRTGVDLRLDLGATITGTVKDAGGAGVGGEVVAYRRDATGAWQEVNTVTSARGTGRYWIAGLRSGTFRVGFTPWDEDLLPEFYNDKPTLAAATDITVARQAEVTGISAVVARNTTRGIIAGKVTGPAGALSDAFVTAMPESSTDEDDAWYGDVNPTTGTYQITGLPAGRYIVQFVDGDDLLQTEYYNEVLTRSAATPVTVTAGQTTANINATLAYVASQAGITGTVTSSSGAVNDAEVTLYVKDADSGTWFEDRTTYTAANGTYAFRGLTPDAYRLGFGAEGFVSEFYNDKATIGAADMVTPTSGQTVANVNAVLAKDTTLGAVRGTLTAPILGPVADAWITVYRQDGSGWESVRDGASGADGTYVINGLPAGTYRVGFQADGIVDEYYADAVTLDTSTALAVTAGGSVTANATLGCEPAGCPVKPGAATISGTAAVGQTLTLKPGSWGPSNAALTYRWFRSTDNGQLAIVGATGATYKVRPADVGAALIVRVKGSAPNRQTRSTWSRATAVVVESVPVPPKPRPVASVVSVSAKGAKKSATFTITVRAAGRTPTGTVTIKLGAKRLKVVALRGGKATVKVTKQKKGKKTYTIVYSGGGGVIGKTVRKAVKIK